MKKISIMMLALISTLFPCLIMSACTTLNEYLITASWDTLLGSVTGFDNYKSKAEGTSITLKAIPKADAEFVCWIKDHEVIVDGNEGELTSLTLTYGQQTAGNYTALFREKNNYQSMQYAKLVKVELQDISSQVEIYWRSTDIEEQDDENSIILQNPTVLNDINTKRVVYLGGLGKDTSFRFSGTVTTINGQTTTYNPITFDTTLSKSTEFNMNGNSCTAIIQGSYESNKTIKLTFEKL